jgi:hypothetical protein
MSIELLVSVREIKALEESGVADRLGFFPFCPNPCAIKNDKGSRGIIEGGASIFNVDVEPSPRLSGVGESGFRV